MVKRVIGGAVTRRGLLSMIGMSAGGAAMYQAMTSLGFAADSSFKGPIQLSGAPTGASVLVLGAGIAGLVAAYELRKAGYQVQVLEYNARAGGRNWTLARRRPLHRTRRLHPGVPFDPGLYINPGPWRLPYHHRGMLSYCKTLGVRSSPSCRSTTTPICTAARRSAANRSAFAPSKRTTMATSPNSWRRRRAARSSMRP